MVWDIDKKSRIYVDILFEGNVLTCVVGFHQGLKGQEKQNKKSRSCWIGIRCESYCYISTRYEIKGQKSNIVGCKKWGVEMKLILTS